MDPPQTIFFECGIIVPKEMPNTLQIWATHKTYICQQHWIEYIFVCKKTMVYELNEMGQIFCIDFI